MNSEEIKQTIIRNIKQLSEENGRTLSEVGDKQSIMDDLGLTSLQIAALISLLEAEIGVDPFMDGNVSVTDVRTVEELCKAYETTIAIKTK